jgi:hypothetical protein
MESTHASQIAQDQDGELQFTLQLHSEVVTAVLSEAAWEGRFGRMQSDSGLREIYMANRPLIEAAVVRRLNHHKQDTVVLRSMDL